MLWTPRGKERAGRIEAVAVACTHERVQAEQTASATLLHGTGKGGSEGGHVHPYTADSCCCMAETSTTL